VESKAKLLGNPVPPTDSGLPESQVGVRG
jgi:hypothetical protein